MSASPATVPLKRLVNTHRPITYGIVQAGEDVEGGVPYVRPVDMQPFARDIDPAALRTTSREIAAQYKRSMVQEGDLIVSIGPSYGKLLLVPRRLEGANLTQGTARVAPAHDVDGRFLQWTLASAPIRASWEAAVGGATFGGLNLGPLSRTPVPLMSQTDQGEVADFLDRECERLGVIRARLERTASVLDEQRSADVEALTDHPPIPLKHGLVQVEQGWSPDCEASLAQPGAWGVLKAGAPNYGWFSPDEHKALPSDVEPAVDLEVRVGDVLMSRANTPELVGSTAVVETTGGWRLMLCDKLYRLVPRTNCYWPRYLAAALSSRRVRDQIETGTAGASASMQNITQELVRQLRVPCPPVEQQARVEAELGTAWRRREMLRDRLKDFRNRLSEYRDALITEAVTGTLEVMRLSDSQLDESAHAASEGERPEVLSG